VENAEMDWFLTLFLFLCFSIRCGRKTEMRDGINAKAERMAVMCWFELWGISILAIN